MKKKHFFKLVLMVKISLLAVLFITNPAITFDKIIILGFVIYLNFVFFISSNDNKFTELMGFSQDSNFYKTYLDLMIDTIQIADEAINTVLLINSKHDCKVVESIEVVKSCCHYLKTIEPPKKYKEYHNGVVEDLEEILLKYA
ncbi:hypothetical protein [Clostridium disporicum]|uniref:hypothetical protein n=1 Tax=Clostridium disporicum TaxID=84024 RepID=UPI0034A29D47